MKYPIHSPVRLNIYDTAQQNRGWNVVAYSDGEYTVEDCWEGRQVMVLEHEIECQIAAGIRLPHQPEGSRHG